MDGKLFVVPTPVGNLKDMTLRGIEVLREAHVIYCEDTRHSMVLLSHYDIKKPLLSLHKFNEMSRVEEIQRRLEAGEKVAYISDAGTPGISDPIIDVVRSLPAERVSVLPGATAFVPALVASGLSTEHFFFYGFLPQKGGERKEVLKSLSKERATLLFYESPHRIKDTLKDMWEIWGNRTIAICRELSKLHEEILRLDLKQALEIQEFRGEMVLVVEGALEEEREDFRPVVDLLLAEGLRSKSIVKVLQSMTAFAAVGRNQVYEYILNQQKEREDL
ncbi:MAG: 16S rRNA (cytidine(1402)-2'-O)-methyltransferase [Tissierellia bacterium]|nr:16S rRNA (cytidine(1402)-2'-O)-methyltransferase [Tissierellia bacterium]